jgi:hypothetical protein
MSDRLPLQECGGDEILARIAFQLIRLDYASSPDAYDDPTARLLFLTDIYYQTGLTQIAADIRLAAIWCGNGGFLADWLRSRIVVTTGRASRLARAGRSRRR